MAYFEEKSLNESETKDIQVPRKEYKDIIKWRTVGVFVFIHLSALYGAYLIKEAKLQTIIWTILLYEITAIGVVAGVHRLWSHNSYKVKRPLELLLAFFCTVAAQKSIYRWARDHRVHHKYTDTDADPHNSRRGFFYSHIGWLMMKKNPLVMEKGKTIFLDDLHANPVVMFQHRYYYQFAILLSMVMPTLVPMLFWKETMITSFFMAVMLRYCFTLHMTWLINSAAHKFGSRPYDKNINPTDNWLVSLGIAGDGWHNFHHAFPWDYRSAELGGFRINLAALFIEFMAKLGQAYDLKTAPSHIVLARMKRTGILSATQENTKCETTHSWGYGDETRPYEESFSSLVKLE